MVGQWVRIDNGMGLCKTIYRQAVEEDRTAHTRALGPVRAVPRAVGSVHEAFFAAVGGKEDLLFAKKSLFDVRFVDTPVENVKAQEIRGVYPPISTILFGDYLPYCKPVVRPIEELGSGGNRPQVGLAASTLVLGNSCN